VPSVACFFILKRKKAQGIAKKAGKSKWITGN